jgi:chloramphenicol 3-O-phosphotransferase
VSSAQGERLSVARTFVVVGPPAAGKSTTSRALCETFPRSVHISVDKLRETVVTGLVLPSPRWSDELAQQVTLARESAIDMAARYEHAGFTVVVDDFVDPHGLVEYERLSGRPDVRRVVLFPSQEEAHRRNVEREGDTPERDYIDAGIRHVYGLIRASAARLRRDGWHFVDSTSMTVDQTVARIKQPADRADR